MPARPRKRFSLLLYKRYHQAHSGFSKFLIALGVLLLLGEFSLRFWLEPLPDPQDMRLITLSSLGLVIIGIVRFLFTLFVSKMAYVECRAKSLKVRTPFFPLVISYRRIRETSTAFVRDIFPPEKYKRYQGQLSAYWGESVILIPLKTWPLPYKVMKAIMGPLILNPSQPGLVLLVEDWMAFSRQLDQAMNEYHTRRSPATAQDRLYSQVISKKR